MAEIVKLKIKLGNQELDYEGPSETFAEVYKDFLAKVNTAKPPADSAPAAVSLPTEQAELEVAEPIVQKRNGKSSKGRRSYPNPPMDTSINLHGDSQVPSLRTFFAEKRPTGNLEANAVFAFYLTSYCGLATFNEGHIRTCFVNVNARMPAYIRQSLIDAKNKGGYVEPMDDGWKLTVAGENLVRHDLPKNKGREK